MIAEIIALVMSTLFSKFAYTCNYDDKLMQQSLNYGLDMQILDEVRYIQNKEIILKSGKLLENYNDKLFIIDNFDCCSFYCARGILSRK